MRHTKQQKVGHTKLWQRLAGGLLCLFLLLIVANIFYEKTQPIATNFQWGVSFSPEYATELGLDWKATYAEILQTLAIKRLRLNSYWRQIETEPGKYNFDTLDYLIDQATDHQATVLLVIGSKQPHWPECFSPQWARQLSLEQRQERTLDFIQVVLNRYKDNPTIWAWQVENEPLFNYGAFCDPLDVDFLTKEVGLVRTLDPTRPIVVTDSGELGFWKTAMQSSDIFGTTLYRTVHNPIFGYFSWPLPPAVYQMKSFITRSLFANTNKRTIIAELQTEPWLSQKIISVPVNKQGQIFSVADLASNLAYAKRTRFDEAYLWGVEWWYFMEKNGHPEYLEFMQDFLEK